MDKITFDEAESRCGRKQTVLSEFCQGHSWKQEINLYAWYSHPDGYCRGRTLDVKVREAISGNRRERELREEECERSSQFVIHDKSWISDIQSAEPIDH